MRITHVGRNALEPENCCCCCCCFMSVSGSKFIENRKLYIVGEGELKTNFLFIKEDDSFFKNTRRLGR